MTLLVKTNDVEIEYIEMGTAAGVPLLFVHGFPDSPIGWRRVIESLDLSKFRIVIPYLRGFGATRVVDAGKVGGQQAALGHDLLRLMDELAIKECHVIGHDWGSTTVCAAAILAPERLLSMVTLASPYVLWKGGLLPPAQVHGHWYQFYFQLDVAGEMFRWHAKDFCHELWRTWSPAWQFSEQEFDEAADAWMNPQFAHIVLSYYRMRWKNALGLPAYAELQKKIEVVPKPVIQVPTLHIQGLADGCVLPAGVDGQEQYFGRGYQRVELPGVGHFPHREQPREVSDAIARHVDLWS